MAFSNSLCFYFTRVERVALTNHIVSMKDEKEYLKPNVNVLIKWWIPLDLLQL
jgi:hypothetical protein